MSDIETYKVKIHDKFDVSVEYLHNIVCMGKCRLCGKDLPGKGDVFIVECSLFPTASVHRSCCDVGLQKEISEAGFVALALQLEAVWNEARKYSMWF